MLKKISSIVLIFIATQIFANVTLTNKEYDAVLNQLKKNRAIINTNNIRWNKLKSSTPIIHYKIIEDQVVIQSIEIPIYRTKPLIYEVKFKVEPPKNPKKYIPLTLFLCGMLELESKVDAKIGIRFFSLEPLGIKYFNVGFNALVGVKSSGVSISYTLPKPFNNTSVHIYTGMSYKIKTAYGIGVSLNF